MQAAFVSTSINQASMVKYISVVDKYSTTHKQRDVNTMCM